MKKSPDVKQQVWGQVSNKLASVHRLVRFGKVVVRRPFAKQCNKPHGFQGPKCLIEKAKIALSTENVALYYYDQVKRFK